ncbi:MAG: hypothetical protein ACD_28C00344G0005, partial [uncultured bacterium]
GLKRKANGCVFLIKMGKVYRCGIHALRPLVCQSYPFSMETGKPREILRTVCPDSWALTSSRQKSWTALGRKIRQEAFQYQGFLETWQEEGLPRLNAGNLSVKSFRERFRRFLLWIQQISAS